MFDNIEIKFNVPTPVDFRLQECSIETENIFETHSSPSWKFSSSLVEIKELRGSYVKIRIKCFMEDYGFFRNPELRLIKLSRTMGQITQTIEPKAIMTEVQVSSFGPLELTFVDCIPNGRPTIIEGPIQQGPQDQLFEGEE